MEGRKAEGAVWYHYVMKYYDQLMRKEEDGVGGHSLHNFETDIPDWYISEVRQLREYIISDCHDDRQTLKDILSWDAEINTDSKVSK